MEKKVNGDSLLAKAASNKVSVQGEKKKESAVIVLVPVRSNRNCDSLHSL
ncbi:hypothetical protein [Thalassobacillus sp. C254]|nr:hypothetical protein [Thalassobacillus sp. C254]